MAKRSDEHRAWHRLVNRAEEDPFFLGVALAAFRNTRGLDDEALAQWLECSPSALDRLKLCRWPDQQEPALGDEIRHIAVFAPCNAHRLIELHREVSALTALRGHSLEGVSGLLMAARDRQRPESDDPDD